MDKTDLLSESWFKRHNAVAAIKNLTAEELESALTDADEFVRVAALTKHRWFLSKDQIARGLADPDFFVRHFARGVAEWHSWHRVNASDDNDDRVFYFPELESKSYW